MGVGLRVGVDVGLGCRTRVWDRSVGLWCGSECGCGSETGCECAYRSVLSASYSMCRHLFHYPSLNISSRSSELPYL